MRSPPRSAGSGERRTSTSRGSRDSPISRSNPTAAGSPASASTSRTFESIVEAAVGGKTVTQIYEGDKYFDLQVRYPEDAARTPSRRSGPSSSARRAGARIPLSQVADIAMLEGPSQISRESGERRIGIECNINGRDLGGFVAEARRLIGRDVALPPGYFLDWGGQFESQQRAMQRLAIILPATIGLILLLLFVTFGSLRVSPSGHPRPALRPDRRGPGALRLRALSLRPGLGRLHRPVRHRRSQRHRPPVLYHPAPGGGEADSARPSSRAASTACAPY